MPGMRFTTWLAEDERAALRGAAEAMQCSENFVVRLALRQVLMGKPLPPYMKEGIENARQASSGVR